MTAPVGKEPPLYRLYLDESGDHVFHDAGALQELTHRFLALCGCFFEKTAYIAFYDAWEVLKRRHFPHSPDEPVIMHRREIMNRAGPFWRLRNVEADRAFTVDVLEVINLASFTAIVVVIDKYLLKTKYPSPFHPYHIALDFMLQRYAGFLNHTNRRGDVLAESRGGTEDTRLKNAYQHIYTHGDMQNRSAFYQRALTSQEIKLMKKKENVAGLQLVDIIAYPLRQFVLIEHGFADGKTETFGDRIQKAAHAKLNKQLYTGRIEGYGTILFPK